MLPSQQTLALPVDDEADIRLVVVLLVFLCRIKLRGAMISARRTSPVYRKFGHEMGRGCFGISRSWGSLHRPALSEGAFLRSLLRRAPQAMFGPMAEMLGNQL